MEEILFTLLVGAVLFLLFWFIYLVFGVAGAFILVALVWGYILILITASFLERWL